MKGKGGVARCFKRKKIQILPVLSWARSRKFPTLREKGNLKEGKFSLAARKKKINLALGGRAGPPS